MTMTLDFPTTLKLFDLNSGSSVYIVAEDLESAIEFWIQETGLSRDEAISDPVEVPRENWLSLLYEYPEGGKAWFETQISIELNIHGRQMPFFLASEEW